MNEEIDIDLLEDHLDGPTESAHARALALRLAAEPALAAQLETVRAERALRQDYFSALEPTAAQTLAGLSTLTAMIREQAALEGGGGASAAANLSPPLRISLAPVPSGPSRVSFSRWPRLTTAAACLALGLGGGALLATRFSRPSAETSSGPLAHGAGLVSTSSVYVVQLRDSRGSLCAAQEFNSKDKAEAFVRDLDEWQKAQEELDEGGPSLTDSRL